MFPDYEPRLTAVLAQLAGYRVAERIDWRARVEAWLSNFEGLRDQRLAMTMLERLRVVSEAEIIEGCRSLLETIQASLPRKARLLHFAHETSGGLLVRLLEKDLRVRSFAVLRQADFTNLGALGKLRDGDAVVVWDRFNGTGRQLARIVKLYGTAFAGSGRKIGALHFAYIAGHRPKKVLPPGAVLHRWIEDIPVVSSEEKDMCDRYAEAAGATETNRKYETGALLTFADNPPNNAPLVLRAPGSDGWSPLLARKETARP
ncbi:hypothetical protein BE21_55125 [Sorangium cellulosum]|uniref:PRTase-CE domain-containing protein n=1 Tax=Sorangium cellulosum TaxID=56 RepID=A0A150TC60_SORCE|nr:hypothetical protein BE21_55125 [Sorangium cellulosum]